MTLKVTWEILQVIKVRRGCKGPLESYDFHCGRYHSTLDYIFLYNCLLNNVDSAETFEPDVENTSDHLPILVFRNSLETKGTT